MMTIRIITSDLSRGSLRPLWPARNIGSTLDCLKVCCHYYSGSCPTTHRRIAFIHHPGFRPLVTGKLCLCVQQLRNCSEQKGNAKRICFNNGSQWFHRTAPATPL